jgi:hypothetical protein
VRSGGRSTLAEADCPLHSVKASKVRQTARVYIDSASTEAFQDSPAYNCGGVHGYQPWFPPARSSSGVGRTAGEIRGGEHVNGDSRRAFFCPLLRSPAGELIAHQPDVASRHYRCP